MSALPGLIDVHSHFLTDRYVSAARRAGIVQPDGTPTWPTWSEADHLALMDSNGIDRSILSISTPGVGFLRGSAAVDLTRHVNDFGSALHRNRPDRFGHFASLPLPDVDAACAEAERAFGELGSDGVTVETSVDGVYLADPAFVPLWQLLDERGAVVFVHPTSPPNWQAVGLGTPNPVAEFLFESARCVLDLVAQGVIERWPNIKWVFTHSSGVLPLLVDRADTLIRIFQPDRLGDSSVLELVGRLWFDLAGTPIPRAAPALVAAFGADRLVYGSDYCFTSPAGVAGQIHSMDAAPSFVDGTWRSTTSNNARRLLS